MTDFQPLTLTFETTTPPLILGLYRVVDQLLLAQRTAEKQLLATCWLGEANEKGFTARFLAGFDLTICAPEVASLLETWKHCPLTDNERRVAWLFATLFAKNLHGIALKYMCDYLPESEGPLLLQRLQQLHAGRLALEHLETGWFDDPMHLVQAGQTPILTASAETAAGVTQGAYVGVQVNDHTHRDFLVGELLAARPQHIVITDDLPDAPELVNTCQAAGLPAVLYSEHK